MWVPPVGSRNRRLDVAKVRLPGEVLLVLGGALRRCTVAVLAAATESIGVRARLVVDLSRVCRIDRAGVDVLTALCATQESDVWLVGAAAGVRRRICRHAAPLQARLVAAA